jgi:hypothetical protein
MTERAPLGASTVEVARGVEIGTEVAPDADTRASLDVVGNEFDDSATHDAPARATRPKSIGIMIFIVC